MADQRAARCLVRDGGQLRLLAVVALIGLLLSPVVGTALSALSLREPLAADLPVGAVLILGGAMLAVTPGRASLKQDQFV